MSALSMIEFKTSVSEKLIKKLSKYLLPGDIKVSIVLEGILRHNGEEYDPGILLITSHSIYVFGKILGLWSNIITFGLTAIREFVTSIDERDGFHIRIQANSLIFRGADYLKGAQILYRNIKILTEGVKKYFKFKFHSNDSDLFPPINLPISPIQNFQFSYFYSSIKFETFYEHNYINEIYKQIRGSDYVFDITQLPENSNIDSFAYAAAFMNFFHSFVSDFPTEYSPAVALGYFLQRNIPLSIVTISNPKYKEDLDVAATALELHHNRNVIFWKIANGSFKSKRKFIRSILMSDNPIQQIELDNIGLDEKHLITLFKGLTKNKKLHQISRLSIRGANMTNASKLEFLNWMTELSDNGVQCLKSLDISNTGKNIGKLCHVISTFSTSIRHLSVSDNKFDEWSESQLVQLAMRTPSLISLDVSGCNFSVASLTSVIRAFVSNAEREEFHMKFGNQNLSAVDISGCASSLLYSDTHKWKSVDLSGTELEHGSALMIFSVFSSLSNLSSIILDGCCSYKLKGIGEELARLIDLPNLKTFSVRGNDDVKLKKEAYPIIEKLSHNDHLLKFDISFNEIGSKGIQMLDDSLTSNFKLEEINADGSGITSFEILSSLVLKLRARPNTLFVEWFTSDAKNILSSVSRSKRNSMSTQLRSLRADLNMSLSLHRNARGIPNFRSPLIEEVGQSFMNNSTKILESIGDRFTHSCSCDALGLPLPFQPISAKAMDYGGKQQIDIGQMSVYNTECMRYVVTDGPPLEPELDEIRKALPSIPVPPPIPPKSDTSPGNQSSKSKSTSDKSNINEETKAPDLPVPEVKPTKIKSNKSKGKLGVDFEENQRFVQKTAPPLEVSSDTESDEKHKKHKERKETKLKNKKEKTLSVVPEKTEKKHKKKKDEQPTKKKVISNSSSSDSFPKPQPKRNKKNEDLRKKTSLNLDSSSNSENDSYSIKTKKKFKNHSKLRHSTGKRILSNSDDDMEIAEKFKPRRIKSNRVPNTKHYSASSSSDEFANFKPPRPIGKEIDLGTKGRRFDTYDSDSNELLDIPRRMPHIRYH